MIRYYIVFVSFLIGCSSTQKSDDFRSYIGNEKSIALDLSIKSYESFLEGNYPSFKSNQERSLAFLQTIFDNDFSLDENWKIDTVSAKQVLSMFETSELRKELWLYNYEAYEDEEIIAYYSSIKDGYPDSQGNFEDEVNPHEINDDFEEMLEVPDFGGSVYEESELDSDTLLSVSPFSRIVVGLNKYGNSDEMIRGYTEAKIAVNNSISPYLIISAFIENSGKFNFDSYFAKTIIVTELYYDILVTTLEEE